MTRVSSSAIPLFASEVPAERGPTAGGSPFRAALRAARKTDRPERSDGALAAQAHAAERAAAQASAHRASRAPAPTRRELEAPARLAHDGAPSGARGGSTTMPIAFAARAPAQRAAHAEPASLADQAPDSAAVAGSDAGAGTASAATTAGAAPSVSGGPHDDSPVAALLAAAVGRAFGAFGRAAPTGVPAPEANPPAAATAATPTGVAIAMPALSPLEQAIHDLLGQLGEHDTDEPDPEAAGAVPEVDLALFHAFGAAPAVAARDAAPSAAAPVHAASLAEPADLPANPSHLHLVLDDGPERVVVTVAMRGSDVHVALRASDDATSAALARNAGSLDHAMRARGLVLGELTTEREPRDRRPSRDAEPREQPTDDAEPFKLEETP